jgi:predicted PurR-regulated permease PerM
MGVKLTERQERTVAAALTTLSALILFVAVAAMIVALALFVRRFSNVFLPLAVAAVAAFVVQPVFDWLRRRLRLPIPAALALMFLAILIPLAIFLWLFGELLVEQIGELIRQLPAAWDNVRAFIESRAPEIVDNLRKHGILDRLEEAARQHQQALLSGLQSVGSGALTAGRGLLRGVGLLFTWAVLPIYFAFFLMIKPGAFGSVDNLLPFLKDETKQDVLYLGREFVNILIAFFRGQLIIALLQGLLFAIGFTVVGLRYGFIFGLVMGLLNVVPYLGSIMGLAITLPVAFFQEDGGLLMLALTLLVFTIVQMIEGYFLTPKIMGDRTGLHPMVIILAIFFWGSALGGIMGMVLAIPLTAFLEVFWRLARDKYITGVV